MERIRRFFSPEAHLAHLRKLAAEFCDDPKNHIISVKSLSDVLDHPPFSARSKEGRNPDIIVFCDFDAVVVDGGLEDHLPNFLALRRIIRGSTSFTLWSSRVPVGEGLEKVLEKVTKGKIPPPPFFDNPTLTRLHQMFTTMARENCQIENFMLNPLKIFGRDKFYEKAEEALREGVLVIIGSSFFDRRRIEGLLDGLKNMRLFPGLGNRLYYFDTGRLIL